jgi:hypothetical protein
MDTNDKKVVGVFVHFRAPLQQGIDVNPVLLSLSNMGFPVSLIEQF